ncbi:MAG: hypothetical protein K2O40_00265 [Lachnospiraceae bacterium]|nr:hypothetical protein [Lachnospiraceae bacterium]
MGVACILTLTPLNCELKSGESHAYVAVDGSQLGVTHLLDITPKDSYKGTNVKFQVSIRGAQSAILYARGEINSIN